MSNFIDVNAYIKYCYEHWIPLNVDAVKAQPTADVVEKEKWDGLLENSIILADAVQKYQLADVVEVVRCEDCMWNYIHVTPKGHDYHICRLLNLAFDNNDDFFCAYGEKRNECGEPIPRWRGQMDGCLPFQKEVQDEQIH